MKQQFPRAPQLARLLALALGLTSTEARAEPVRQAPTNVTRIAEDLYIYGFPLVLMDLTKQHLAGSSKSKLNEFQHASVLATAKDRTVVRPNADTLYSTAWLDLSKQPVVMRVPATDRYYVMEMLDAYTNVFAAPGPRTTGKGARDFFIAGPNYRGQTPKDMIRIDAPTNMVWILGRVQVNGAADLAAATKVQLQFSLRAPNTPDPAPQTSGTAALGGNAKGPTPPEVVLQMDAPTFFSKVAELMKQNPPAKADAPALAEFSKIGLVPGKPFAPSPSQLITLDTAIPAAQKRLAQSAMSIAKPENGWQIVRSDIGTYGTDYDRRAAVALYGLGANLAADAVYPGTQVDSQNQPLTGKSNYTLHFTKENIPPANAFWSLTMYDDKGYFVDNPINRYAIGDRDKMLFNRDGSLDILVQHEAPSAERKSNWLPAPEGPFTLLLRLYSPKPSVLDGQWVPPPVRPAQAPAQPAAAR